jgi:hypothetical protein
MHQDQAPLVGAAAEHFGYLGSVDLIGASGMPGRSRTSGLTGGR